MTRTASLLGGLLCLGAAGCGRPADTPVAFPEPAVPFPYTFTRKHPPVLVVPGTLVEISVPVKNPTGRHVRFGPMACTCYCMTGELPKVELAPEEEMTVRLGFRPLGRDGVQRVNCSWTDEMGARWTAAVEVEVCQPQGWYPNRLLLGVVGTAGELTGSAEYRQYATGIEGLPEAVTFVTADPRATLAAGEPTIGRPADGLVYRTTPVTVRVQTADRVGRQEADVTPRASRHGEPGDRLAVEWTLSPPLAVIPNQVVFVSGGPSTQTVLLRAGDGHPFRILQVTTDRADVTAQPSPSDRGRGGHTLTINWPVAQLAGNVTATVCVETSHPAVRWVQIPVSFFYMSRTTAKGPDVPTPTRSTSP